mmetsp:Transcript_139776/g.447045  ORF Transcript_139776/g.447045 Transcript_139776/m.447045 type:complete len:81 (-) Transcript_139776:124-366(-)
MPKERCLAPSIRAREDTRARITIAFMPGIYRQGPSKGCAKIMSMSWRSIFVSVYYKEAELRILVVPEYASSWDMVRTRWL